MPFFLAIFALFIPRVVIAALWFFTSWFSVVESMIIGLIGFFFLPYTLLWYTAVAHWYGGTWGPLQIIILVLALLLDIGVIGGSTKRR